MVREIVVQPYDPSVRDFFEREKILLLSGLGTGCEVHHIGSTSVPGLGGLNIIDMLLIVPMRSSADLAAQTLKSLGYARDDTHGDKERIFFRCNRVYGEKKVQVELHVMRRSSSAYKDYLLFRDYLREHPGEAARYFTLKQQWLRVGKREAYSAKKAEYIRRVLEKAGRRA